MQKELNYLQLWTLRE